MAVVAERDVVYRMVVETAPETERTLRDIPRMMEDSQRKIEAAAEKSARARVAAEKKVSEEAKKADKDRADSAKKLDDELRIIDDKRQREQERRQKTARAEMDKSRQMMKQAGAQMHEATNVGMEGVLKMGRGFAMLGMVGEESTQKILMQLIKVQAAFDLIRGALEMWKAMRVATEAYATSVAAATAAQNAFNASASAGAAGAGAGAGAAAKGAIGGGIAGMIGKAMPYGLAVAGGGLLGWWLGLGIRSVAMNARRNGMSFGQQLDQTAFSSSGVFGKTVLAGGHLGTLAGRAFGFGGSSMLERVSESEARADRTRYLGEQKEVMAGVGSRERMRFRAGAFSKLQYQIGSARTGDALADARMAQEKLGGLASGQERSLRGLQHSDYNRDERLGLMQSLVQLEEQRIAYLREEEAITRQTAAEKVAAARQALAITESELAKQKQISQAASDRLTTARQALGAMTVDEQTRAVGIFRRMKAGEQLSLQELQSVSGIQSKEMQELVGQQFGRRFEEGARERGLGELMFGERSDKAAADAKKRRLDLRLGRQEVDVSVALEDEQALVDEISGKIKEALTELAILATREVNYRQEVEGEKDREAADKLLEQRRQEYEAGK